MKFDHHVSTGTASSILRILAILIAISILSNRASTQAPQSTNQPNPQLKKSADSTNAASIELDFDAAAGKDVHSLLLDHLLTLAMSLDSKKIMFEDELDELSSILDEPEAEAREHLLDFEKWIRSTYRQEAPNFLKQSALVLADLEHQLEEISMQYNHRVDQLADRVNRLALQKMQRYESANLQQRSVTDVETTPPNSSGNVRSQTSQSSEVTAGEDECVCTNISDPPPIRVNRSVPSLSDTYRQAAQQFRWAAKEARKCGCSSQAAEYERQAREMDAQADALRSK